MHSYVIDIEASATTDAFFYVFKFELIEKSGC